MLWSGFFAAAALVCLGQPWIFPAVLLAVAYGGAQRLEARSIWFARASIIAILGIGALLLDASQLLRGRLKLAVLLSLAAAFVVFALLGLWDGRKNVRKTEGKQ